MTLTLEEDGSIVRRDDGVVLHFSPSRFKRDIVEGDCCFLCGASRSVTLFDDEHVIPDWILREFAMHNRRITLANGAHLQYSQYKVPCCVPCNRFLGAQVEEPISLIMKGGHDAICAYVRSGAPWLLFKWLALIYLKTHLKDCTLRYSLDARGGTTVIGELYDWEGMHHIHCVVRTLRTGTRISTQAIGSLFFFPAKEAIHLERFDYGDLIGAKALYLRFRDIAVVCVLNDACGCLSLMQDGQLGKLSGPLSPIQLREVFVRIAYMNTLITTRPTFYTTAGDGMPEIVVQRPACFQLEQENDDEYGALMLSACRTLLESYRESDRDAIIKTIRAGRGTFLFGPDGEFVANSMDLA
jgi:hypothetical protein